MQYEIDVDIDASPEKVWATLTDIEHWPSWTDSVVGVERLGDGEFRRRSAVRVKQPRLPAAVWTVTEFEPGKYFSWTAKSPGVTTVGGHDLVAEAGSPVNVKFTLQQTGALAPLVGLLLSGLIRRYMEMEAQGLKRRCES